MPKIASQIKIKSAASRLGYVVGKPFADTNSEFQAHKRR